jgi:hypothetical protein
MYSQMIPKLLGRLRWIPEPQVSEAELSVGTRILRAQPAHGFQLFNGLRNLVRVEQDGREVASRLDIAGVQLNRFPKLGFALSMVAAIAIDRA